MTLAESAFQLGWFLLQVVGLAAVSLVIALVLIGAIGEWRRYRRDPQGWAEERRRTHR